MLGMASSDADPNKYLNQTAVTGQKSAALSALKDTTSSIGSVLSITKQIPGVPSGVVDTLKSLNTDATGLMSKAATMGPDAIEKERSTLDNRLEAIQASVAAQEMSAKQKAYDDAVDATMARVTTINADSTVPANIKAKFTAIQDAIMADISGNMTPDDILEALQTANEELLVFENKEFSSTRFLRRIGTACMTGLYYMLFGLAILFGGIIASNAYAKESFWGVKAFYFFYGAAFFPLTLLYGVVRPPHWYAAIAPFSLGPVATGLFGYQVSANPEAPSNLLRFLAIGIGLLLAILAFFRGAFDSFLPKGTLLKVHRSLGMTTNLTTAADALELPATPAVPARVSAEGVAKATALTAIAPSGAAAAAAPKN
jgi:hypothetical protein